MINDNSIDLDRLFSALSDVTRRTMLSRLAHAGEMSVAELSAPFNMSKPAITKHLKVLERAGLLSRTIIGRQHQCRLEAAPLGEVSCWLNFYEKFWSAKLESLDEFLLTQASPQTPGCEVIADESRFKCKNETRPQTEPRFEAKAL